MISIPEGATHHDDNKYLDQSDERRLFYKFDDDGSYYCKHAGDFEWEPPILDSLITPESLTEIKQVESMNIKASVVDWDGGDGKNAEWALILGDKVRYFFKEPKHIGGGDYQGGHTIYTEGWTLHKRPVQESIYTQEMVDDKRTPDIGMKFMGSIDVYGANKKVECICIGLTENSDGDKVITFEHSINKIDVSFCNDEWVKPIDTRTQAQKDKDETIKSLKEWNVKNNFSVEYNLLVAIQSGKIPNLEYKGEL